MQVEVEGLVYVNVLHREMEVQEVVVVVQSVQLQLLMGRTNLVGVAVVLKELQDQVVTVSFTLDMLRQINNWLKIIFYRKKILLNYVMEYMIQIFHGISKKPLQYLIAQNLVIFTLIICFTTINRVAIIMSY
jgi:hypothetical protein